MPDTTRELSRETIVPFLADIFARRGDEEYLGEPVTMAQHMLQGATLAERQGLPEEVIVAALLHDIGHFTSEFGTYHPDDTEDRHHEDAGAEVLAPFFPSLVIDCVRYHVAAKRYLCATRPDYLARLSDASRHTLELQGGPMTPAEAQTFEANPNIERIVQVRYLDERAKDPHLVTPGFGYFAPMVQRVVDRHLGYFL
jgi:phosphonate degradation associated HDIG domain protein